ncbi:MAG: polysaccharide deacetylase family protein [Asticcacaulis sp.]
MKSLYFAVFAIILLPFHAPAQSFDVAITVDDLPLQGQLPVSMTRLEVAESYLKTLKAHKVPEAYGFVNASKIEGTPDGDAVLDLWRSAGYPLGNHGYTHMNLNRAPSLADWIKDMEINEPAISSRMAGENWRVLRFPNLAAGGVRGERHEGAHDWLRTNNYSVAEATLSFSDWAYAAAYVRCLEMGNHEAIRSMDTQYIQQIDDGIAHMKALSNRNYGRVIPQVLLTHLSPWSARTLPWVMERLEAAGARFVSLAEAQSDPAYNEPGQGSGMMMERAAKRLGTDTADLPRMAGVNNLATLCLP